MPSLRAERGQATVDYVAILAVVCCAFVAAATVTAVAAPGVANAVLGQFRRALCVVSGGACPVPPRRPCTVASTRDVRHVALNLALVRLDDDRTVLRERLSDGTIRLTVAWRGGAGVEVGAGARARVDVRGRARGLDREVRAGVQGVLGHGEVFYARSEREVDALLRALRRSRLGGGASRAREIVVEGGVRGLGRVGVGGARAISGQFDGIADAMLGARRDRRSGNLEISFGTGGAGAGLVAIAVGGNVGALDGQAALGLTLDRRRRPVELSLSAAGSVAAGDMLPAGLARPLRLAADPSAAMNGAGRQWELDVRVALTDPAVAAAWAAFRRAPTSTAAIRALGEQLRSHARLDVRSYRLDSSGNEAGAAVGLGLRVGGELEHTIERLRLLSAATRPPFGVWEARVDCVAMEGQSDTPAVVRGQVADSSP
jgi:hypothetical protein